MYSDKEVHEELRLAYKFLKKYGHEHTLVYLLMRMEEYQKREGDL